MYEFSHLQSKKVNLVERLKDFENEQSLRRLASPFPSLEVDVYNAFLSALQNRLKRMNDQPSSTNFRDAWQHYKELISAYEAKHPYAKPSELTQMAENSPEYKQIRDSFDMQRQVEQQAFASRFGHNLAYIIVIGYDPTVHKQYTGEGVFSNGTVHLEGRVVERKCIGEQISSDKISDEFYFIGKQDRAVLLDSAGIILGTNVHLKQNEETETKGDYRIDTEIVNKSVGLLVGGAERQRSSMRASKLMKGTVIITLGETGIIRRFVDGEHTLSTDDEEDLWIVNKYGLRTTEN